MNRYKFIDSNGEHLHTLDGKPLIGTSTIASSIGKGQALSWWASGKACEAMGWVKPIKDKETFEILNQVERIFSAGKFLTKIKDDRFLDLHYLDLLDNAYKAHSQKLKESAKKGVDLHSLLELYINQKIGKSKHLIESLSVEENKILEPFIEWEQKNVKKWEFSEIHVYSEKLWVGGIVDAAYVDMEDNFVIVDFKSGGAWFSGFVQLGGYEIQLMENFAGYDADGREIYRPSSHKFIKHAIFPFKGGFKNPDIGMDTAANCRAFEHACHLYKEQQRFYEWVENGKQKQMQNQ